MSDILTPHEHFPSLVYTVEKPEYLDSVVRVSNRYLDLRRKSEPKIDPLYPVQTAGYAHEPEIAAFTGYIAQAAWTILNSQGHDVQNLGTYIQEMWTQEHRKFQGHDTHIHNRGAQITAFYVLDAPEGGCKIAIHDPRHGKNQVALPESDLNKITIASETILFIPKPGTLYFINSWLPHSVTRNPLDKPTRLVHINLGVKELPPQTAPASAPTVI